MSESNQFPEIIIAKWSERFFAWLIDFVIISVISTIAISSIFGSIDYDFNENPDDIDPVKLEVYREEFDLRLNGISKNIDHVLAYNPNNNYLRIKSNKIKVLLAAHIFGDAASAHISMFQTFEDWTKFFLNYFADKTDDFLLVLGQFLAAFLCMSMIFLFLAFFRKNIP